MNSADLMTKPFPGPDIEQLMKVAGLNSWSSMRSEQGYIVKDQRVLSKVQNEV